MKFLIFQHYKLEHPGVFRKFMDADGIERHTVDFDRGDSIPPLDGFDALWIMGGAPNVWEEGKYPYLTEEKLAIQEAVADRNLPTFGICLGHQLLAEALGGHVGRMDQPEVGVLDVSLTDDGTTDPLMAGVDPVSTWLQWHEAEIKIPPPGARILATSPASKIQAMRVDNRAFGVQFHPEPTHATVPGWAAEPSYLRALEEALGPGAHPEMEQRMADNLDHAHANARHLYDNFKTLL